MDSRLDSRMDDAALAQLDASEDDFDDEAPEPGTFGLRMPVPTGEIALRATNLGIRYNLNLTKKTKLQTSFATCSTRGAAGRVTSGRCATST